MTAGNRASVTDGLLVLLSIALAANLFTRAPVLQSALWMLCYGIAIMRILSLWRFFFDHLSRQSILLVLAVVCMASTLWSLDPKSTLTASSQFMMTCVIGIYLGWRFSMPAIAKAMSLVLGLAVIASLLHAVAPVFPWLAFENGALVGVFPQKNMLGQAALFLILATLYLSLTSQKAALTTVVLIVSCVAVVMSKSVTSIVLLPLACSLFLLSNIRFIAPVISVLITVALLFICMVPALFFLANGIDPIEALFQVSGKESTLTGRTEIWKIAASTTRDAPFLGIGFYAFWTSPELLSARLLTQHAGAITSTSFHNAFLEIRVAAGWPGLTALTMFLTSVVLRALRLRQISDPAWGFLLTVLILCVALSLLTPALTRQHEFALLISTMLASSASVEIRRAQQVVVLRRKLRFVSIRRSLPTPLDESTRGASSDTAASST